MTDTSYTRSIGELVRKETESVHNINESVPNTITSIQISNRLQLTFVETYFKGMVGEQIIAHSYFLTNFDGNVPTITSINTVEELKEIYNKLIRGRNNRKYVWSFIKDFNGYAEDPRPYVE